MAATALPLPDFDAPGRVFALCPWTTVRGNSTAVTSIVQDPEEWLELDDYSDATFVIECAEVTNPSGRTPGYVLLYIESSVTEDEGAFRPVVGPIPLTATPVNGPIVVKTASASSTALGRLLRYRIVPTGLPTTFDATFRITGCANRQFYFTPTMLGGVFLWLRADRGLTFTNQAVTGWADQSGSNDPARDLVAGSATPTFNVADSSYGGQATISFNGASTCYFTTGQWNTNYSLPKTYVFVAHQTSASATHYLMDGNTGGAGDTLDVSSTGVISAASGTFISSPTGNTWLSPSALMYEATSPSGTLYQLNSFSSTMATGPVGSNVCNSISLAVHSIFYGGGSAWPGTIAEVIAFAGTLSTTSKQLLRTYLTQRYGLAIS